jgi:protein-export membrane protein SecD
MMDKSIRFKFYFSMLVALLSIYLVIPTLWSLYNPQADKLPKWLPKTAMTLGLDLKGGVHMVLGVDLEKVVKDQMQSYTNAIQKDLEKKGIQGVKTTFDATRVMTVIESPNESTRLKVSEIFQKDFSQVLDIVDSSANSITVKLNSDQESYVRTHALDQSIETLRNRIDEFGVAEPILARKGDNQILVQFPGASDTERLKALIGQTAQLKFQIVHGCKQDRNSSSDCLAQQQADLMSKIAAAEAAGKYTRETFKRASEYRTKINEDLKSQIPADTTVAFEKKENPNKLGDFVWVPYLLSTKNMVSGEYIENAFVTLNREDQFSAETPVVSFQMNAVGAPMFGDLTTEYVRHYMAIVLDDVVKSAPVINTPITGGSGIITLGNNFSADDPQREARDLAVVLRAGALPATIEAQEERVIGPSIGQEAIDAGKLALSVTAILVFSFMWLYYGMAGLVGNFITLVNVAMIFAVLGLVGATLTLPGIAGIILTLGMAVDSLIIIFERMREEIRLGRSRKQVIDLGFDKAFSTILDSNITTAIGGFVLLNYGTGSIRGFALTLLVGIIANLFIATYFARAMFEFYINKTNQPMGVGLAANELTTTQTKA